MNTMNQEKPVPAGESAKMCPLLSLSDPDSLSFCEGSRCAWYVQGRGQTGDCALACLAEIARGVKRL